MQKRLTRSRSNRRLFGVIGGIGEYFGLDDSLITIIRIVFVLLFLMFGFGLIPYIVLAIVIPSEDSARAQNNYKQSDQYYNQNNNQNYSSTYNTTNNTERKIKDAEVIHDESDDDWSDF